MQLLHLPLLSFLPRQINRNMATIATAHSTSSYAASTSTSTPHSYLDLKFELPEKRYVGCLACQRMSTHYTRLYIALELTARSFYR